MVNVLNWLENKLIKSENGIIFNSNNSIFDLVQGFIENNSCLSSTPIIYYQAFPQESSLNFFDTLNKELASKIIKPGVDDIKPLESVVKAANLKMIIIDRCHIFPLNTLEELLLFFSKNKIVVILIGSQDEMTNLGMFNIASIITWENISI